MSGMSVVGSCWQLDGCFVSTVALVRCLQGDDRVKLKETARGQSDSKSLIILISNMCQSKDTLKDEGLGQRSISIRLLIYMIFFVFISRYQQDIIGEVQKGLSVWRIG